MADQVVELDQFAAALSDIVSEIEQGVKDVTPEAVKTGLKTGAKEWRSGAPVDRGKYKKSIRWHMTDNGTDTPSGEIGSPSMPGLPHLLEKGHARIGGGRVPGIEHIAPAAEVAFDETMKAVLEGVGRVLG